MKLAAVLHHSDSLVDMHLKIGACVAPQQIPSWRPPASVATPSTAGYTCVTFPPLILYRRLFSYCVIYVTYLKLKIFAHTTLSTICTKARVLRAGRGCCCCMVECCSCISIRVFVRVCLLTLCDAESSSLIPIFYMKNTSIDKLK